MDQPAIDGRNRAFAVIALVLAALALRCIWRAYDVVPIAAPFQADYEEGNILNALSRILSGATPWPDPRILPNVMNPYGPVAYYLLVLPVKVFGLAARVPAPDDPRLRAPDRGSSRRRAAAPDRVDRPRRDVRSDLPHDPEHPELGLASARGLPRNRVHVRGPDRLLPPARSGRRSRRSCPPSSSPPLCWSRPRSSRLPRRASSSCSPGAVFARRHGSPASRPRPSSWSSPSSPRSPAARS